MVLSWKTKRTNSRKACYEASRYFSDVDVCIDFVASMRWPYGVSCPHCRAMRVSYLSSRRIWKCMNKECHKQFSVKTLSVFEDSPIPLDKWLVAVWLVVNCKNGVSSYEIARDVKVTQKSAWFMLQRIRLALKNTSWEKIGGKRSPVEVDETFIGGDLQNMHRDAKVRYQKRGGAHGKAIVMGMLDRKTRQVRAKVIPNVKRETLQKEILKNVGFGSTVYTDKHVGYDHLENLRAKFVHDTVNHMEEYVRGEVHTQGIENFWSLLKRSLTGTYVAVEPFHLERYVDEQAFRFNNRKNKNDADRFKLAVSQIAGKRLTYAELTGKVGETSPA
jgi:transposase-like protein